MSTASDELAANIDRLAAREDECKSEQRERRGTIALDYAEGDRITVRDGGLDKYEAVVARDAFIDEDSLCVFPITAPAWRQRFGPLHVHKDHVVN